MKRFRKPEKRTYYETCVNIARSMDRMGLCLHCDDCHKSLSDMARSAEANLSARALRECQTAAMLLVRRGASR